MDPLSNDANLLDDELLKGDAFMGGAHDKDEDEEDEDEEDDSKKSVPSENDLMKALDALDATAAGVADQPTSRQAELAGRLAGGDSLSKSEAGELAELLSSGGGDVDFAKSARESFMEDDSIEKAMEVSSFMEAFVTKSSALLDLQREVLQKGFADQNGVNVALATAMRAMGAIQTDTNQLVKSMAASIGVIEKMPRAAKGVTGRATAIGRPLGEAGGGAAGVMAKSQGTGTPPRQLQKTEVLDTIERLIEKSDNGYQNGIDLGLALTKYEGSDILDRPVLNLVLHEQGLNPVDYQ